MSYVIDTSYDRTFSTFELFDDVLFDGLVVDVEVTAAASSSKMLSSSKQREYCDYISSAKRDVTKHGRLEKIKPMIILGAGLHDKYKNC